MRPDQRDRFVELADQLEEVASYWRYLSLFPIVVSTGLLSLPLSSWLDGPLYGGPPLPAVAVMTAALVVDAGVTTVCSLVLDRAAARLRDDPSLGALYLGATLTVLVSLAHLPHMLFLCQALIGLAWVYSSWLAFRTVRGIVALVRDPDDRELLQ